MKIPLYKVDAFTEKLFGGNPAAVCLLQEWPEDVLLQCIAKENNLAETAFVVNKNDHFHIRWFTAELEMDLCGHATLATAHVIFNHLEYNRKEIRFESNSGELTVTKEQGLLHLNFPSRKAIPIQVPDLLLEGLRARPKQVLKARDYLVIYDSEAAVRSLVPDLVLLEKLEYGTGGIIITARGETCDFVSRYFTPGTAIPEDPVTGSAHCSLIPYWSEELGKKTLHAWQLSKRKGELFCRDLGERVLIGGKACSYFIGEIGY